MGTKIKVIILDYRDKNPTKGFFEVSDVFGLTPKYILEMLEYKGYEVSKDEIIITDSHGYYLYHERNDGTWFRYGYNGDRQLTEHASSTGYVQNWEYNEEGLEVLYKDSEGDWSVCDYDEMGEMVEYRTPDKVFYNTDLELMLD